MIVLGAGSLGGTVTLQMHDVSQCPCLHWNGGCGKLVKVYERVSSSVVTSLLVVDSGVMTSPTGREKTWRMH